MSDVASPILSTAVPAGDRATPLLVARGLTVVYPGRDRPAVADASIDVGRGETLGLVGESGSGKSSLGGALLGLVPIAAGTVCFDGEDITHATPAARRRLARRMQVVFQDPYGSMNPSRQIGDTVGEMLRYTLGMDRPRIAARVTQVLADVGLPASAATRYPGQFSGGQRQRIAIARAVAADAQFLVCDEPVSALDLSVQAHVLNVLADLQRQRGLSYLFVSHNLSVVRHVSDRIAVMFAGHIVEQGSAEAVADRPVHPYTQALLAAAPVPDPALQRRRRADRHRLGRGATNPPSQRGCVYASRCPIATPDCSVQQPPLVEYLGRHVACTRLDAALGVSHV